MSTLTIKISRDEVRHLTKTRPFIHTRKCMVLRGEEYVYLKEVPPPEFGDRFTTAKLILEGRFFNRLLPIPKPLEKAIAWHINRYATASIPVDDEQFAFRVAEILFTTSFTLRRTRKLRVGDHIFFMKDTEIVQKAVYLGAKLCILVWEVGGPLEVTGIHDIKQALGATHIATWHPHE